MSIRVGMAFMKAKNRSDETVTNMVFYYNVPGYAVHPMSPESRMKIRANVYLVTEEWIPSVNGDEAPDRNREIQWRLSDVNHEFALRRDAVHIVSAEWRVAALGKEAPPFYQRYVYPDYDTERDVFPFAACRVPRLACDAVGIYVTLEVNPATIIPGPDQLNAWIWDPDNAFAPASVTDGIPYDRTERLWNADTMEPKGHDYNYEKAKLSDKYIRKLYDQAEYWNSRLHDRMLILAQVTLTEYGMGNAPVGLWKSNPAASTSPYPTPPIFNDDKKVETKDGDEQDLPMPPHSSKSQSISMPPHAVHCELSASAPRIFTPTNAVYPYVINNESELRIVLNFFVYIFIHLY